MAKRKHHRKRSQKRGLAPGSLVYIGERKAERAEISFIDYDEGHFEERKVERLEDCFPLKETPTVSWINVNGLHEVDVIERIGTHFEVHPLVLEDILNTGQRPKVEEFDHQIFVVLRMLAGNSDSDLDDEQLSMVISSNVVLTFQERAGDVFEPIRERLRRRKGRIRTSGSDYLAYALIDIIVDSYFNVLEVIGDRIEDLSEQLVEDPGPESLHEIHALKRQMVYLRRGVWPQREVVNNLLRTESGIFQKSTLFYLRDVYDHTVQVLETMETFREMVSGMLDIYLSSLSNRMNEVMKVLTIIATIFIPVTFVAGVYGMNFTFMPELQWKYGYFGALLLMLVISLVMVAYFRRRHWL